MLVFIGSDQSPVIQVDTLMSPFCGTMLWSKSNRCNVVTSLHGSQFESADTKLSTEIEMESDRHIHHHLGGNGNTIMEYGASADSSCFLFQVSDSEHEPAGRAPLLCRSSTAKHVLLVSELHLRRLSDDTNRLKASVKQHLTFKNDPDSLDYTVYQRPEKNPRHAALGRGG